MRSSPSPVTASGLGVVCRGARAAARPARILGLVCATVIAGPLPFMQGVAPIRAAESAWRGRALVDVLRAFEAAGLRILYSSAVVAPSLRVTIEPVSRDPRAILDEILPPLGLRARDGPDGTVLIVAAAPSGVVRGRVVSSTRGAPVAGAAVSLPGLDLRVETDPDGAFRIEEVPVGPHEVQIEARGFIPRRASVEVRPARARDRGLVVGLEPRPDWVEEVVVTPGRISVLQQEQPPALSLGDEDVLLAPSFGGDVSRVVETLPGLAAPDNSAAFHVRGSLARDVSYVLDGLELYEPYHLQQFQSPFSHLDTDLVDRVDFLSGAFTADHGDRHGGIVQLSTRSARDTLRTQISVGNINSHISHTGRLERGDANWLASIRQWYPEAFRSSIEIGETGLEPLFGDAYLSGSFVVSPRTLVSLHALVAYDGFDFEPDDEDQVLETASDSGHFWLRGVRSWSAAVTTESILSGGWIDRSRKGISDPEDELIFVSDDRRTGFFGLKQDVTWRLADTHRLKGGIEVRHLDAGYRYRSLPVDDPAEAIRLRPSPSGQAWSAYAAHRVAFSDAVAAEFGLRWDRQAWIDEHEISPRLNVLWRLADRTDLRIGLGEYYQSQRIYELRIEDGETDFRPPERSRQVGLTLTHRFRSDVRFRIDAYYRSLDRLHPRYENLFSPLELYPETEPDRVLVAPDGARLRGVELLLQAAPGARFYWRAGYTLSAADDSIMGRAIPRSWDQTHAGSFLVGYRPDDRWFFTLAGTAHTGWPTTPFRTDLVVDPSDEPEIDEVLGARNSDRFPPYLRFDVKASRLFTVGRSALRVEVEVLNVTDRRNVCCVDDVEIEVAPDGRILVDSTQGTWLGLTPTFRITWEF